MHNSSTTKTMNQITNNIMMIEPVLFNYNTETAQDNHYQNNNTDLTQNEIQQKALNEFNDFVSLLRSKKVNVHVFKDTKSPETPDSIFPNNWISFHNTGEIFLFPMFAKNRRLERRYDIIDELAKDFDISNIHNLTSYEAENIFLEGTGSMILDNKNKICYAAKSKRTNELALNDFCNKLNYRSVLFHANQTVNGDRLPIYHTNVMMCIAENFVIICLDSIDCEIEKNNVINIINKSKKEIIEISEEQANNFAGNMLQIEGDEKYLVMSKSAYSSLSMQQINKIETYCKILYSDLSTIENFGGGSARCMMAEIFLPLKK